MHPRGFLTRFGSALILTLIAATASAQPRFYVGGTAIADIRRFDTLELDPRILADISSRDGTAPGGGVRVGTFLHPRWSLELAVDAGSKTSNSFQNPIERLPSRSYESTFPAFSYIPIELPFMTSVSSIPGLVSVTQAVSTITGGTLRRTDNSVGGVFGLEAAIDLSDHFALVPSVRAIVFSSGGQSIFLIRPEAGMRWNF